MQELKGCPFCGAEAKPREYSEYAKRVAKASKMPLVPMVQCTGCGAMVSFDPEHDHWPTFAQQAANEYWNNRAERTCKSLSQYCNLFECSSCGCETDFLFDNSPKNAGRPNYCHNCGARVEGD